MNVSDSEIVQAVLEGAGMKQAPSADEADLVLINTCAVRENAESKVATPPPHSPRLCLTGVDRLFSS